MAKDRLRPGMSAAQIRAWAERAGVSEWLEADAAMVEPGFWSPGYRWLATHGAGKTVLGVLSMKTATARRGSRFRAPRSVQACFTGSDVCHGLSCTSLRTSYRLRRRDQRSCQTSRAQVVGVS